MDNRSIPRYVPAQPTPSSSRIPLGKRTADHAGFTPSSKEPPSTVRKTQSILQHDLERRLRASQQKEAELFALLEEAKEEIESGRETNRRLVDDEVRRVQAESITHQQDQDALQAAQQTIHRLRAERNDLQQTNAQQAEQLSALTHQTSSSRTSFENEITLLTGQLEVIEEERKDWQDKAEERKIEVGSLRRQLEELVEELEKVKREEGEEAVGAVLREELHRQAKNLQNQDLAMSTMKAELSQLRQRKDDVEVLQQEIKQLDRAWGDKCHLAEEMVEKLRSELDSLSQPPPTSPSESAVTAQLQSTLQLHQDTLATLSSKEAELASLQNRLEALTDSSRSAISTLSTQVETLERELRLATEGRKNAEMRAELIGKEVRMLDEVVSGEGGRGAGMGEGELMEKVRRLEDLLETYKTKVEGMERDSRKVEEEVAGGMGYVRKDVWEDVREERDRLRNELAGLQSKLTSLPSMESELSELRTQTSALESEVSMLERRVARGEYNPETFQCLQLALNPSTQDLAIRTATLQALREENQALLGMLADKGVESVPKVSMDLLRKEKEEEKAQLEKRLLRLKEVFQAKSQEFIDTLYSLLGYRINFSPNGDVRLNTTYAPKTKSGLTFKFSSQEGHFGTMQLTGGMAKSFDELRDFWVTQRQEIPCFLASVVLELYDRTTRGKAAGWVRPVDPDDEDE